MNDTSHDAEKGLLTLVTLSIGRQTLAIPAAILREVLDPMPMTRVPGAGAFSPGVLNVRGSVVPLADLGHALGLPAQEPTERNRIVVIEAELDGERATVAMNADAVHEVTSVPRTSVLPVPDSMATWPPEYLSGLYKSETGFVLLPDLNAIFAAQRARKAA